MILAKNTIMKAHTGGPNLASPFLGPSGKGFLLIAKII